MVSVRDPFGSNLYVQYGMVGANAINKGGIKQSKFHAYDTDVGCYLPVDPPVVDILEPVGNKINGSTRATGSEMVT